MEGGTLQTIAFEESVLDLPVQRRLQRQYSIPLSIPPPAAHPTTLDALASVIGLRKKHSTLADREWRMPSLAIVRQEGWGTDSLGGFVRTSTSLQHIGGCYWDRQWASVFERMPVGGPGQKGPLARLESMGDIKISSPPGLDQLQEALSAHGCHKSLKRLDVSLPPAADGTDVLLRLCALEQFITSCCAPSAVPVEIAGCGDGTIDLGTLHSDHFPTKPSPRFITAVQELATKAETLRVTLPNGPLLPPKKAAIDLAPTLLREGDPTGGRCLAHLHHPS
ncbi:unnamed protein product [Vitrella brassicaformis CCMP3155]|uniref:Uncharacterized protein n=1 Tax=Vitrella brassicaformis (strain CCMP3155) TaxID=1169540 RepID=A0A0G4FX09_VITBC|nr:unnamed protein product [Vitrella brassicaformis CCMP3155]|eukprot:CEM19486.1 unnamed protein product [Vitrella brassicaformis CCMP3155]